MYAVIKTGGRQYRVKEGDLLEIEKLNAQKGQRVIFDQVFLIENEEQVLIGTPVVADAAVTAEVLDQFKGDKVLIFKKKRRKQYRRTKGHRQQLAKVLIVKIYPDIALVPKEELQASPPSARPAPAPKAHAAPKKPAARPAAKPKPAPVEKKAKKPAPTQVGTKKKAPAKPAAKPKKAAKE
jgi:large subunit ribosomal protein L21